MTAATFIPVDPTVEDCWRGIILYGQNSASYKFALAQSLLQIKPQAGQLLKLEDLAPIFGKAIAAHLGESPKQGTSKPGKFLQSVSAFNIDSDLDALVAATLLGGFQHVIDAFHNVGSIAVAHRFFIDERKTNKGIRITDEFSELAQGLQIENIAQEVDSRWRLVETAWNLGVSANLLVIQHDQELSEMFTIDREMKRKAVTSSRSALNGYQKGRCFYCFSNLKLTGEALNTDVDHFFPHRLKRTHQHLNLDGIWNLVLSCQSCNRGSKGKFDRIPSLRLLKRLHIRNEFLIGSHHPLRETLIRQSGATATDRTNFLFNIYKTVQLNPQSAWEPEDSFLDANFCNG